MHQSLDDLIKAINGEIGMSSDIENVSDSLFNGFLPQVWRVKAPQTKKSISDWISHFKQRHAQYMKWVEVGEPICMWISGLHLPGSYLTALIQMTCRSKGWALDKSTNYTIVTEYMNSNECTKRLESGSYINGL